MSIWTKLRFEIHRHEELESRNLLAGHGFFGPSADAFAIASSQANQIAPFLAASLQAAHNLRSASSAASATEHGRTFTASLTDSAGGTGTATVSYSTGTVGGVSAAVLTISGDTAQEGQSETVTIGDTGTRRHDFHRQQRLGHAAISRLRRWPPRWPPEAKASVGTLTGSFAASTNSTGGNGCSGGGGSQRREQTSRLA